MKKIVFLMAAATVAYGLVACGQKKQSEDIIAAPVQEEVKPQAPIRMQIYNDDRNVEWIGKTYHVTVHRQPADSLPMVKDENGQKFVDNVFTLTVSRSDGSVFFNRRFTKENFLNHIPEEYRKGGIMEGIVFDKADGDWLQFAASVGIPQTDEYVPLIVRLSRMGELSVSKDAQMDTNGDNTSQQGAAQPDADEDDI